MKIRTQLIISVVLFAIALLIIAASVVVTNQQVDRLNQQQVLIKNIELGAGELGYLSNDYLLYHESQQLDRWNSKYAAFSDDLSNLSVDTPEQGALVNNIRANQQRLKGVFGDVVSTIKSTDQSQPNAVDPAFIQLSWSRLAVQTRGIIFDASRLSQMLQEEENQVKQTNTLLIFALTGAFVAFLLIDYLLIYGRAVKSIVKLQAGARIIGSGNLDHQIKAKKGDEVGELADAFNQMTARLKIVTASKADLEREITERQRAEDELRRSEASLAKSQEMAHIGSWELDVKTGDIQRSAESYRIFGVVPGKEKINFEKFMDFIVPEDRGRVADTIRSSMETGLPYDIIYRIKRKDGEIRVLHSEGVMVKDDSGVIIRTFGTNQDITERKQAEEALKEAKMQAELYLDLMGHDISNMHQIILGQLELVQEIMDMDGRLESADKEMIDTSVATLQRSARLIENIRNIQKLRMGEYKFGRMDLGEVLDEAVNGYSRLPNRDISISYIPVHGYYILANPLLKDIFNNLLDNAVKHCDDPVRIDVSLQPVDCDGNHLFEISVEDNGHGIPDDKKFTVFHRLKRGDTKARGTGLGLYIVRTLVESFGGSVRVEDRVPGDYAKGARFVVCLPADEGGNDAGL